MGQAHARPGRSVRAIVTAVPAGACYPLAVGLLGRARVRALLRQPARPLPSPRVAGVSYEGGGPCVVSR